MWTRTETGWEAASSQPFPDEATLQSLIMETLQLLPLEGSPSLAVLGSSVRLEVWPETSIPPRPAFS